LILFDGRVRFKGALNLVALYGTIKVYLVQFLIDVDGERNGC